MSNKDKDRQIIFLDRDLSWKLNAIYLVKKTFYRDKQFSKSGLVSDALKEYFANHCDEVEDILDKYHGFGRWV